MFFNRRIFRKRSPRVVALFFLMLGCTNVMGQEGTKLSPLHLSPEYYNFIQPSFSAYLKATQNWLSANRSFIGTDQQKELRMNMPFERIPEQPTSKAALLVHGLGDSPFSFVDISNTLKQQGFYVQVLLLPGHGSKPKDMVLPEYQDWQRIVDHYATLLKQEYQQVWLGGFSTGANLVTIHSIEQKDVAGLLLFSPAFESKAVALEKITPLVASIWPQGWQTEETNLARYSSASLNGAIAYSKSAEVARDKLAENTVSIPTFIAISEHDSVVKADAIKDYFIRRFIHPANKMLWYGEEEFEEANIITQPMSIPNFNISTGSHMSPLFAPCNHHYGMKGEKRMCGNGQGIRKQKACERGDKVWYSAWGHWERDKVHARLTWNPYYANMSRVITNITNYQP